MVVCMSWVAPTETMKCYQVLKDIILKLDVGVCCHQCLSQEHRHRLPPSIAKYTCSVGTKSMK